MKIGIGFEEAVKKAKRRNPKYNVCIEHPNAWAFHYDDGTDDVRIGGADTGVIIMKEDGRMLLLYEYYMNDRIGSDKVLSKISI